MKLNFVKFSLIAVLSLFTSTLFAQDSKMADIEKKLTDNSKQWMWYSSGSATEGPQKSIMYTFLPTHKVEISNAGKKTTASWKLSQSTVTLAPTASDAKPAPTTQTSILIGAVSYVVSFGSSTERPEYMVLATTKPVATDYFYSILPR